MRVLLYGSSDFGRLLRRQVEFCGHHFEGYVDDMAGGPDVLGRYGEVRERWPPAADRGLVMAVGYKHLDARWAIYERVRSDGYELPPLVHPAAWVHPEASIGEGTFIGAGATVDAGSQIGPLTVLWPGAIVSHDAVVGENCFLSPGAIVCGFACVGRQTFVGAGAVVPDHADVPIASFVRAGSVAPRSPLSSS